jgi:Kef-type K+ transport system membrane component KefB
MSTTGEHRRGVKRGVELFLLLVLVGLMLLASNATHGTGRSHVLAALGFLLLAGTVAANVLEPLGIPHLTAYLLTGMAAGPYALQLVDHQAVEELSPINALALSLISLAGGAELRVSKLISAARSLLWATLLQNVLILLLMAGTFLVVRPLLPFTAGLPLTVVLGIALLWGVVGITRSPSATLGVLSQTGAKGPLATFTLAFVMTSDVVVVIVLAVVFTVTRPLLEPGAAFSLRAFQELGHEVLGSVALGSTLGLLLAAYLRFVGRQLVLVFVALGLVMTQVLDYLRFDWLLIFITAGFVVQNLSAQGDKFLEEIDRLGEIVFVIFFATAGAHLDLPLLALLWPAALALAVSRAGFTFGVARLSSRLADDPPGLRRWGWAGLVSQAGLALGIAGKIQKEHPGYGAGFAAMAVATVALNELVGPILFKTALDRSGETARHGDAEEPAATPPPAVDPAR